MIYQKRYLCTAEGRVIKYVVKDRKMRYDKKISNMRRKHVIRPCEKNYIYILKVNEIN